MRTFDDHSLEFWGDVFQACRLSSVGVTFEDFMQNPQRILQDFGMDDAIEIMESGYLPLLPKQARIRAQLERPLTSRLNMALRLPKAEKPMGVVACMASLAL